MAISRPKRPALIVSGTAVAITPRRRYDEAKKSYTDELTGYEVTVSQESGAQLSVRYSNDRDGNLPGPIPTALDRLAVVVEVTESREYGASLQYIRNVVPDDLDKIHSALPVAAGK